MVWAVENGNGTRNHLLRIIPHTAYPHLASNLEPVYLHQGETLYQPNERIRYAYFPTNSVIVTFSTMDDGWTTEVAMGGCRGFAGVHAVLNCDTTPHKAVVLISGGALKISAEVLKKQFLTSESLHDLLLRYTQMLLTESRQLTACANLHPLERRLCRWLLSLRDCVDSDTLPLTHEKVSQMLGVRREGITLTVNRFVGEQLLLNPRGAITILDRRRMEEMSCECYRIIKREYDRLLPWPETTN